VTIELDTTNDGIVNLVTVYNSGAADDVIVKSNQDTGADALCEGAAWAPHTIAPVNYTLATGYADNVHGTVAAPCNFKPSPFSDATVFKGAGTPPVQGRCLAGTVGGCYDAGAILITAVNVGCTLTQGFWKTHGPIPTGNNSNEWPTDLNPAAGIQTSMTLGTLTYTPLQLLAILNTEPAGNGLITLAHQLIAAKLNIQNGASSSAIAATITAADALIGSLDIDGGGYLRPNQVGSLVTALTNFNEGIIGPGHCSEDSETD
jgi:hypothetical protein